MTDKDEKQLPSLRRQTLPAQQSSPLSSPVPHGVVDSAVSGFVSDMQARSIDKHTKKVRALTDNVTAHGELADAYDKTSRAAERLRDLDKTINEDQLQRDHVRWENERARQAARAQAAIDDGVRAKNGQTALEKATVEALKAETDRLFHERLREYRLKRADHNYAAGALQAEDHHLTAQRMLSERRAPPPAAMPPSPSTAGAEREALIGMVETQIEDAISRNAPNDAIGELYKLLVALKAERSV